MALVYVNIPKPLRSYDPVVMIRNIEKFFNLSQYQKFFCVLSPEEGTAVLPKAQKFIREN